MITSDLLQLVSVKKTLLILWFSCFILVFIHLQAVAGLAADGRQIVARAKSEANNYERLSLERTFMSHNLYYYVLVIKM